MGYVPLSLLSSFNRVRALVISAYAKIVSSLTAVATTPIPVGEEEEQYVRGSVEYARKFLDKIEGEGKQEWECEFVAGCLIASEVVEVGSMDENSTSEMVNPTHLGIRKRNDWSYWLFRDELNTAITTSASSSESKTSTSTEIGNEEIFQTTTNSNDNKIVEDNEDESQWETVSRQHRGKSTSSSISHNNGPSSTPPSTLSTKFHPATVTETITSKSVSINSGDMMFSFDDEHDQTPNADIKSRIPDMESYNEMDDEDLEDLVIVMPRGGNMNSNGNDKSHGSDKENANKGVKKHASVPYDRVRNHGM